MLLFQCPVERDVMFNSEILIGDGTFKTCPQGFGQVYSIHSELNGEPVKVCTILMERRDGASYHLAFQHLIHSIVHHYGMPPPLLNRFIIDCEMAAMEAIETEFNMRPELCLFHFAKDILAKAREPPSLQTLFNQKAPKHPVRRFIRRLQVGLTAKPVYTLSYHCLPSVVMNSSKLSKLMS